jgi:hypothetical protein
MNDSKWWFSPAIIDSKNGGNILDPNAVTYAEGSEPIKEASPMSIEIRYVFVDKAYIQPHPHKRIRNDLEFRLQSSGEISKILLEEMSEPNPQGMLGEIKKDLEGLADKFRSLRKKVEEEEEKKTKESGQTNDLLILSSFQTEVEAKVQRLHAFKQDQRIKERIGDFYNSMVCSFSDFKYDHITLGTHVYDVDSYDDAKRIGGVIDEAARNITVLFPIIAPFVALENSVSASLVKLLDMVDEHDTIIDDQLKLYVTGANQGDNLLQTGHWVYFNKPQTEALKLAPNLQVLKGDDKIFEDCSYVVYSIRKMEMKEQAFQVNQKIAQILAELNGKGDIGNAAITLLEDTLEGYDKFKKLERILELERKKDRTEDENVLLDKLRRDPTIQELIIAK